MNYGPLIFVGILLTLGSSWIGLVIIPYWQLGGLQPVELQATGALYPAPLSGEAARGREIYRAEGCIFCHSQQVRAEDFGVDIERGWGQRRSVSVDYIYQKPVFLGTMRTGPDLTNIGMRQPSPNWHYLHFYNPRAVYDISNMPAYPWMFRVQRIGEQPSPDALILPPRYQVAPGFEVVPTAEASALVAYMLSLTTTPTMP
jgi:cytochrome c oxidase cbb3-type subunit II